jgi:hypothetical protein
MSNDDYLIGGLIDELLSAGPRRICDSCKESFVSLEPKQMYCDKRECQDRKYARKQYLAMIRETEKGTSAAVIAYVDDSGQWVWNVDHATIHPFLMNFREWRRRMTLERWIVKHYGEVPYE